MRYLPLVLLLVLVLCPAGVLADDKPAEKPKPLTLKQADLIQGRTNPATHFPAIIAAYHQGQGHIVENGSVK